MKSSKKKGKKKQQKKLSRDKDVKKGQKAAERRYVRLFYKFGAVQGRFLCLNGTRLSGKEPW